MTDTDVDTILASLVGQPCWSVIAGDADDYALVADFGEQVRRTLRLANPKLSFLQRTYEGSHSLLVECPWRIDGPDAVAASCFDARGEDGAAKRAYAALAERTIVAVRANPPGYDLVVEFDEGWALRTLATETPAARSTRSNWQCWTPTGLLCVGAGSSLTFATTTEARAAFSRLRLAPFEGFDDDAPP